MLLLGKRKLAGEASTYAKRPVEGGFGTVEGIAGLDGGDLTEAGMRKGDVKTLMMNAAGTEPNPDTARREPNRTRTPRGGTEPNPDTKTETEPNVPIASNTEYR